MVINKNILVRKNISSKLENPTSEIGYYSYTNRCGALEERFPEYEKVMYFW